MTPPSPLSDYWIGELGWYIVESNEVNVCMLRSFPNLENFEYASWSAGLVREKDAISCFTFIGRKKAVLVSVMTNCVHLGS